MTAIKYDDPILGQIDELLGGGIFRTEKRTIGPVIEQAINSGDAATVSKVLTDLGDLKSVSPESIAKTPVLSLAAFGILAADKINARLARSVITPRNQGPVVMGYADILLAAAHYRGAAENATAVVNGKLGLSACADELIAFVCDAVECHKLSTMKNCAAAGESPLEQLLSEWKSGETLMQRIVREQREDEAKAAAAAERRYKRQLAAGFDDEDIAAGLADDVK